MERMLLFEQFIQEKEDKFSDYPKAASKNAKKAIEWKEKYGRDEVQGGTEVGWQRAHQLAKGEAVSRDVLGRMSAFNRHRKNSKISAENKDTPWKDNGHVAWLIWGGDEGVDWAIKKMDELDESVNEAKVPKGWKISKEEPKPGDPILTNNTVYVYNPHYKDEFLDKYKDTKEFIKHNKFTKAVRDMAIIMPEDKKLVKESTVNEKAYKGDFSIGGFGFKAAVVSRGGLDHTVTLFLKEPDYRDVKQASEELRKVEKEFFGSKYELGGGYSQEGDQISSSTYSKKDCERFVKYLLKLNESAIYEEKAEGDRGPIDNKDIEKGLKSKADDTGVPIGLLRIVMRRGMDAWNSGHRPGTNQTQWGYARVNAFLEKGDGTWQKADKDVAKEVRDGGHDKKLPKKY